MARRGSEICPIDLSDDEASHKKINVNKKKKKKRERLEAPFSSNSGTLISGKVKKVTDNTLADPNLFLKRLDSVEEKLENVQHFADSGCNNFVQQREAKDIEEQCGSLEHRVGEIESFLNRLAQAFNVTMNQPCNNALEERTCDDIRPLSSDQPPADEILNSLPSQTTTPNAENDVFAAENSELETNPTPGNVALLNTDKRNFQESIDCYAVSKSTHTTNVSTDYLHHSSVREEIKDQEEQEAASHSVEWETVVNASNGNCTANSNAFEEYVENQENVSNQNNDSEDVKPLIPLPPLVSIKEEISYLRDDQGRILMYLYCAAKKINRASSRIAAVSGMYLTETLHNEFSFQSERGLKEVKIEAEIRAAFLGIEVIKRTFNSLDNVCVMIISSCSWQHFVPAMKSGRSYPAFYCCSCETRNCPHSEKRWKTEDYLGKSQIDVLPELMMSKKAMRVHWCKLEQLSNEEKATFNAYKPVVDGMLNEIIEVSNLPGIEVMPIC